MDEEQLILLVEKYDFLYDLQHPKYSNQVVRENAWEEIAAKMKFSSKDCKQKWKALRDSYKRAIGSRRHKSGQAAKKVRLWKFEREMSFLEKYVHTETKTKTNVADVEEESDNEVTETVDDSEPSILQEDSVQSPTELIENYTDFLPQTATTRLENNH
ncbi:hypothetical protein FQR65_LT15380 [Abscondita terminalis]|nr:hypothetical protein FQR65_LT15380 [Abscondita terminalis]